MRIAILLVVLLGGCDMRGAATTPTCSEPIRNADGTETGMYAATCGPGFGAFCRGGFHPEIEHGLQTGPDNDPYYTVPAACGHVDLFTGELSDPQLINCDPTESEPELAELEPYCDEDPFYPHEP